MRFALLLLPMALIIALCPSRRNSFAQDCAVDPQQILAEFDIFNDGDCIIVPVEIAGKTYRFLVGTGTTYTTFDTSLAGLLGEPIATSPAGPKWHLEPNGKVGKVSLQTGKPALVAEMSRWRVLSGHAIDGILGMSFLSTRVIHLDFDRGKLYFLKGSVTQAGESIPLHFDPEGTPVVSVEAPEVGTRWFRLETATIGCTSGSLDRWTFAALKDKVLMPDVAELRAASTNGTQVLRWGEVRGMSLGAVSLPPIGLGESGRNELGLRSLMRFNVTFDFPGRRLYLTKSKRFGEPDRIFRSGLHPIRQYGDTIVTGIYQGSPAEASGIRAGDAIMEVAGKNANEMRLLSLKSLFCDEGKTIPMTVRRGQQEIPVTIRLGAWPFKQNEKTDGRGRSRSTTEQPAAIQSEQSNAAREHE